MAPDALRVRLDQESWAREGLAGSGQEAGVSCPLPRAPVLGLEVEWDTVASFQGRLGPSSKHGGQGMGASPWDHGGQGALGPSQRGNC